MKTDFMFTSESVTEGHPDKLCDRISDAIVDHFLQRNAYARIVAETAVSKGVVFLAARFASDDGVVDFPKIARHSIKQVGYTRPDFNAKTCSIMTSLQSMPPDRSHYFDRDILSEDDIERIPACNQATVFGFACRQTPAFMPLPIWLAHRLAKRLTDVRVQEILPYLAPDGKTQVGVEYRDRRPYRIHSITTIASQIDPAVVGGPELQQLRDDIRDAVILPVFEEEAIRPDKRTRLFINPEGPFITGGPAVHSGLTGRKTAIDTYGEYSRQSGAALSGKDPTRIDRVGAYAARHAAVNIVAAELADECEVQLSYTIGLAQPVSIQVETFGTGEIPDDEIASLLSQHFDFRLGAIINQFNLRGLPGIIKGGFYSKLSAYGHVGRSDLDYLPWERQDKVSLLQDIAITGVPS